MKRLLMSLGLVLGLAGFSSIGQAEVQFTQVCTPFGVGFYYLPGFEPGNASGPAICTNPANGDTRQVGPGSATWRSLLPYPEGKWVSDPQQACGPAKLVFLGDFKSNQFSLNDALKLQSPPNPVKVTSTQLVTKVIMSGGFYDPRIPARTSANGSFLSGGPGLCVRSIDPGLQETDSSGHKSNPPYGDAGLPIGCIADRRIVNAPLAYAVSATAAYPNIDAYMLNGGPANGPYVYGKMLVVSTDIGPGGPGELSYCDASNGPCEGGVFDPAKQKYSPLGKGWKSMAGTLSVWVCLAGN